MVAAVVKAEGNGGKLVRPWIGAAGEAVTNDIAQSLGRERPGGIVVQQLYAQGPAERAGLKPGDIIIGVNGRDVEDPEGLRFRLATLPVGDSATLNLIRKGQPIDLSVSLIAPPGQPANETLLKGKQPLSGALVINLSPATADDLNINAWDGVAIVKLKRGSISDRVGFEAGDIIAKVNNKEIKTAAGLADLMASTPAPWTITVNRGGKVKTFDLD